MKFLLAILFTACCVIAAHAVNLPIVLIIHGSGGGGPTAFTPLHTFFMAPTTASPAGNDSNSGTDAAHPWATPNHSVVCGDVIIAAPGNYNAQPTMGNGPLAPVTQAVGSCPSMSGGIDGNGGIYFAVVLCGGSDLGGGVGVGNGCNITAGNTDALIETYGSTSSNWAFEGFTLPNINTINGQIIRISDCTNLWSVHHVAFINNVIFNSLQGMGLNDCGKGTGSNPPDADYIAAVGLIAQNANQNTICLGAIDFVGTGQSDSATTAIKGFMAGNFAINNQNASCNNSSDNEGLMFDTLDSHNSNGIWNAYNNISFLSGRYGFQWFFQCVSSTAATLNIANNTLFANNATAAITNTSLSGELNISASGGCNSTASIPYTVSVTNNIAEANWTVYGGSGGGSLYAEAIITNNNTTPPIPEFSITNGSTGNENIFKGKKSSCTIFNSVGGCDSGFNIDWVPPNSYLGTNFFADPSFTNTTDLLSNQTGVPNCSGFVNTTQCMGWNANTSTLTTPSVISDLTAGCAQCAGKGYQRASTTCATSGPAVTMFPTWLKGIVYLHWTGTAVVQNHDLITTPCGL